MSILVLIVNFFTSLSKSSFISCPQLIYQSIVQNFLQMQCLAVCHRVAIEGCTMGITHAAAAQRNDLTVYAASICTTAASTFSLPNEWEEIRAKRRLIKGNSCQEHKQHWELGMGDFGGPKRLILALSVKHIFLSSNHQRNCQELSQPRWTRQQDID